jgi:UDP-perosamine 4-acetyltransferase
MPQLGANDYTGIVEEWLVDPGTEVHIGMPIAVVETSKATVDLEAEAEGFLYPIVETGTEVALQEPIALLLDNPDQAEAARLIEELRRDAAPVAEAAATTGDGDPQLTKRARALVEELGVDASQLPTDRVVRESDVRALAGASELAPPAGAPQQRVAVYGASPGGASLAETLTAVPGYEVVAFLDDTEGLPGTSYAGLPIWAGSELERLVERGVGAVVTHIAIRPFRLELRERTAAAGLEMPNVVHPAATVFPSVRLGRGNVIKAGAVIDTDARLGDCCIIDNGAIVPHHNVIGDAAHLAPGVTLGGDCDIGPETLIGVGAVIGPRITIGRNVIVAPGSVVVRDVPDDVVVEGSPAKVAGSRKGRGA